jgi:hypothetical protein
LAYKSTYKSTTTSLSPKFLEDLLEMLDIFLYSSYGLGLPPTTSSCMELGKVASIFDLESNAPSPFVLETKKTQDNGMLKQM